MTDVVEHVRGFNRRWTEVLGLLDDHLLDTDHTLTESRVLFELGRARRAVERLELRNRLGIDQSFLSRVINRLHRQRLVAIARDEHDGRRHHLTLTDDGRAAYQRLNRRSAMQIRKLLAPLSASQQRDLTEALTVVLALTQPGNIRPDQVEVRGLQPSDLGWVVQRHGAVYADEFGWNSDFEALVAQIVADYHHQHRPGRDNAWIATVAGARAGCVFCVERASDTAQLRILIVEPWARGLGIGQRLVRECIEFAREAGYERIMLWTNDVLAAARKIYQAAGFTLAEQEAHHSFGHDLVGQNWTLELTTTP